MTYDQWKTTDPRELEPEQEDDPSELECVYEQLCQTRLDAKYAANISASRIQELEASLNECLEYFKDRSDVNDGDYGEPSPNKEMRLASMIDETLHGIRF